ncbi:MAG: hypothetical protein Q8Q12_18060 [bacterium]|nr:hypothetical protein [bacterium]
MWTTNARVFCNLSDPCVALPANLCVQSVFLIVTCMVIAQLNRLKRGSLYPSVWRLGLTVGVLALCAIAVLGPIADKNAPSAANEETGEQGTIEEANGGQGAASPREVNDSKPYIRRYDVDGFELDAGFTPDKAECVFGEPVFVTFSAKNLSDKPYGFFVGGDNRGSVRHNRFRITAADSDGRPVKDPYSYDHHGGFGKDVILQSGESYTERLYLGFWCAFDKPGVYDVRCERTLTADGLEPKYPPVPIVTTFSLTIRPFDKEKVLDVIANLGRKLREGDEPAVYEATLALSEIDDEAVIPHLTVSLTKGDFQNRLPAVKGLSRFSTNLCLSVGVVSC